MPRSSPRTSRRLLLVTVGLLTAVLLAACGATPDDGETAGPSDDPTPDETTSEETGSEPTDADQADQEPSDADESDADATEPDETGSAGSSPDEAPAEAVDAMAFADCEAERYTVGYPEDWNANRVDGILGPCEIFHPHPGEMDIPEKPRDRDLHYAMSMYVDDVAYDDRNVSDNPNEVIDQRETTVDGRRARVMEFRSTGEALTPEGEYSYTWSVDLDGKLLVATTSSVGTTDYERDKRVIDRMMTEELTIHDEATQQTSMVAGPSTTSTSSEEPDGWPLVVTDVRVGSHGSFDRLVFEIAGDGQAGWHIGYVDDPRSQGSGNPVDIEGEAVLRVTLRDMAYPGDAPAEPYDGPERITPPASADLVEIVEDTLFEGHHDFFVGLDQERPYRVERLRDPQRIVIDIETG